VPLKQVANKQKYMAKKAIGILLLVTLHSLVFSQVKEPADYTQAEKLYKENKYEAALPLFIKSIPQLPVANKKDSLKLASCYNYVGLCYYMKLDFTAALTNYNISRDLYSALNSPDNVAVILKNISLNYKNARENNIAIKTLFFDSTDAGEIYFSVTKINSLTKDSAIVTINEGKQDGVFLGSKGNMVSSYAVGAKPGRDANEFLGSATIIELSDYTAKAVIYFYKKYIGATIYPKDLLTIKAYPVTGVQKNVFYEMAKLNISFLDNSREEIVSTKSILSNTDPALENVLLKLYTKEITDFYEDIKGYDTLPSFTSVYKNGRFKGYNLIEAFKITASFDLAGFFNFVKTFPGKYMGTGWKINETYATWVLNESLQGEKNRAWLLPFIEKINFAELDSVIDKAGFYIRYDSLYQWSSRITELQNNHNQEAAEQLCNKLLYIAKKLKDARAENEFHYSRSFLNDAQGNKRKAIDDARLAYNGDKNSTNYMYGLASFYGKNDNFDSAFVLYEKLLKLLPGNTNVAGNYGWYKIVAGQFDEAIPLCRSAYYGEPGSVAFSVNYGHCFLLKGNIDSARYYYSKMLDNLSVPDDYNDGPKKDFELFFTKGWQRKNVGEIADWLDTRFNEKYYAITEGNVVWGKAKKYYDSNKFKIAINEWHRYISLFDKSKEPPISSIHNAHNWIGLSYESMGLYDSAIVYYEEANQMALQHLVKERNKYTTSEEDLIVNNYKRMFNFYTITKNETKAQEYKALYDAEVNKVTELFTTPQLHFICVGGNSITDAVSNQSNAKLLFDNLSKLSSLPDSSNKNKLLNGSSLTKDKLLNAIEQVRKSSRPEDIFIFYYAGTTINDKGEAFISFNQKDSVNGRISLNELMNGIDLVYAQKKMIIMDKPNPLLLSTIASKYTAAINTSSEVIFVCPGIETPLQKNNCSLFTNELVNTLDELRKKDKFSAKDFIDKASYTIGRGAILPAGFVLYIWQGFSCI
jgi:tetratricopeptide (TPR) repeat protein